MLCKSNFAPPPIEFPKDIVDQEQRRCASSIVKTLACATSTRGQPCALASLMRMVPGPLNLYGGLQRLPLPEDLNVVAMGRQLSGEDATLARGEFSQVTRGTSSCSRRKLECQSFAVPLISRCATVAQ